MPVIHRHLPQHTVPDHAVQQQTDPRLQICGAVRHQLLVMPNDLNALPRSRYRADFVCQQGWVVPQQEWSGFRLQDVLALAEPLPEARVIHIGAGDYVIGLPRAVAESALLCDTLNGQPLPLEHGAPWRLIVPSGACTTSVKWVDRIVLLTEDVKQPR
ncbi:molybdopterin-dependent oxidoreductase [Thermorudis peleae]|uniref:molybdopterin-dependent oxidoreductase n=1 Tax=Thermorudis peleae TaxID=1382356 RepID=UPI00068995A6|nr:molybdopterin-dependent oxidoreductase [Thermorudis peleae]